MSESRKIFVACCLGGGTGSLVALGIAGSFWWLGALAGSLVGYLSYEWREVILTAKTAYRSVSAWRPPLKIYCKVCGLFFVVVYNMVCFPTVCLAVLPPYVPIPGIFEMIMILFIPSTGLTLLFCVALAGEGEFDACQFEGMYRSLKEILWISAIPIVFFWHLPRGIIWLVRRIPRGVVMFCKGVAAGVVFSVEFVKEFFILVHSELRLLCGVDAMIGASIGYFAGHVLIGALAGGVLGVVNYQIVSVWWLRLHQQKI